MSQVQPGPAVDIDIVTCTGVLRELMDMLVHPNPSSDRLFVLQLGSGIHKYRIPDLVGRQMLKGCLSPDAGLFVGSLNSGTYLLEIIGSVRIPLVVDR